MRQSRTMKLLALLMCAVMLIGSVVPVFAAEEGSSENAGATDSLISVSDLISFISYEEYLSKYPAVEESRASKSFEVSALDYVEEKTDAKVEVTEYQGESCLYTGSEGSTTWKFTVPESGFYTLSVEFCPTAPAIEKYLTSAVERILYINDKVPFLETRYVAINKTWGFAYDQAAGNGLEGREGVFALDAGGNELRPDATLAPGWQTAVLKDRDGFYTTPFEYWLEKGENTITLESIRDEMVIKSFTFAPYEPLKTYEEVKAEYEANGYTEPAEVSPYYINAEAPSAVSHYTVYPIYDHSSAATEPQHSSLIIRNTLGRDKWNITGQWVRYEFEVEKDGLYTIAPRFKQHLQEGIFVSREVRIDGEVPFAEASAVRFNFDKDWQVAPLSDDDGNPYEFYLTAGKHTVEFEVVLGDMAKILQQADAIMNSINNDYLEITKLTGPEADANRDYGFARVMPETVADLSIQSQSINAIVRMIAATSGIKSENTGTLTTMAEVLRKMGSDESKIAANLSQLKEQISSLGEWVSRMSGQPLEFDYILVQPASAELPDANGNSLSGFVYEIQKFFASFFANYDAIAEDEEDGYDGSILVWTSSGREQATIINNLIKDGFTKEKNVHVTLKLVTGGTLLPAILAGTAPDVSIDAAQPIDMAIRGAIIPLNDFETFDEVCSRFTESAMVPLQLYGQVYAIPVSQSVPVMFYRTDILADLGLEVPKTWDEIMSMVPVLQFNNMEVGISGEMMSTMIYQYGGSYWKDNGMSCNFDSTESLDAFETLCNFFTQYSLPQAFNALNRMKTGEMPLIVTSFAMYNTLVVSAPEISGLWKFTTCPGAVMTDENGEEYIEDVVVSSSSGIMMPKSAKNPELAWEFMDWYTDKDFQVDYSNEMVALLGPSAKQTVANLEAFEELPWSSEEFKTLKKGFENSIGIEAYPGDYIIMRYLTFAFTKSYTEGLDPSDMLLEYTPSMNKEITRKRKEFNLMVADEWEVVKEYMQYENVGQWDEYVAENGIEDYKAWMKNEGISVDNFDDWSAEVMLNETTLSYRDWIAQK